MTKALRRAQKLPFLLDECRWIAPTCGRPERFVVSIPAVNSAINTKATTMTSLISATALSIHPRAAIVAALCSCLVLSSCGGREAHPIAATNISDTSLDCGAVQREFEANERQILATVKERAQAQGKNVILGATGVLLFLPALFFIDPKSPEKVEIDALRNRNNVLTELARSKRCPAPKSQLGDLYRHLDGKVDTKDSTKKD